MRMELSRKADYAIRGALVLARTDGAELVTTATIVREAAIPARFAAHVLATLVRAGLIGSKEGSGGGYRLARPASAISLLDLIEAADGPMRSTRCVVRGLSCSADAPCAVHPGWAAAQEAMRASLASTTLAGMLTPPAAPRGAGRSRVDSPRRRAARPRRPSAAGR